MSGDLLSNNLPVLVVLIPLFGGVLSLFARGLAGFWACLTTGALFATSWKLAEKVTAEPSQVVEYFLGGWPAEYGIAYRIDALNAYVIVVVALIAFLGTIYSIRSVEDEIEGDRRHLFYSVWLLAIAGLVGITATGDTFNVYVLLEISSLTVYTLIAMGGRRDRRAFTASLKYLILGSIGATFILLGIGYLLMLTGTLNMADMHTQLLSLKASSAEAGIDFERNRTVLVGFAFLVVGLGLKMALFPLHGWLPNAYTYAPSAVSVLISATATKVGVYMAFRFVFTIFGGVYDSANDLQIVSLCACAGIIISSVNAIRQQNVKKVLAYSSVGQLSYIVLGFSLMTETGISASVIHIFNHAVIKGGMFMAVGMVVWRLGSSRLQSFRGLGKRMPLTAAAFTAGGLGLIGVPFTSGFVSKWVLLQAALELGYWWAAVVVLVGGTLALVYVWRIIEVIWFAQPGPVSRDKTSGATEAPLTMLIPTYCLIGASLYFGMNAELTMDYATRAAELLMQNLDLLHDIPGLGELA